MKLKKFYAVTEEHLWLHSYLAGVRHLYGFDRGVTKQIREFRDWIRQNLSYVAIRPWESLELLSQNKIQTELVGNLGHGMSPAHEPRQLATFLDGVHAISATIALVLGTLVAGEWQVDDALSNSGEQLKLSYGAGSAIRDFTYDDNGPWPDGADGGGHGLVLTNPSTLPDPSNPMQWRLSTQAGGDPVDPLRIECQPVEHRVRGARGAGDGELCLPDFIGIVLDPARQGETLTELALCQPDDLALAVKHDGT